MSIRQHNLGSIVKPGFNALGAQTTTTTYFPYLYTWGTGAQGQLGLGNTTTYSSPKQVGALTDWLNISGVYHTVAVKNNGTLWSWGANNRGQLGLGNNINVSYPQQIGVSNDWKEISAGAGHSLAIKNNGTLWAWGWNEWGQIGNNSLINVNSPVQIGNDNNWKNVFGGFYVSGAIKLDSTLWGWGANDGVYQLGINSNSSNVLTPAQIGTSNDWKSISFGGQHTLGLKNNNTLWSWGQNSAGELGNGIINSTVSYAAGTTAATVGIVVNLVDGIYTWFYSLFDWAGNSFATANNTLTIDTVKSLINFTIPTESINNNSNYISDFEGIACTTDNTILIIDNPNNKLHYFSADSTNSDFSPKSLKLSTQMFTGIVGTPQYFQRKLNGYGDWNGFKYINKSKELHIVGATKRFFGRSSNFSIFSANSGKYELEKVNENFDPQKQIMDYRFQDYLKDKSDTHFTSLKTEDIEKYYLEYLANFGASIAIS
jgi:alpha-tubulin suppressor-like RCC1 family protein